MYSIADIVHPADVLYTGNRVLASYNPDEAWADFITGESNSSSGHWLAIYVDGPLVDLENKRKPFKYTQDRDTLIEQSIKYSNRTFTVHYLINGCRKTRDT